MPTTAPAQRSGHSGGYSGLTIAMVVVIALAVAGRALDKLTVWWDAEGSPAAATWLGTWRPWLTLAGVLLVALVVLRVALRVRKAIRTKPMRKARTRAELRQPTRSDGSVPSVKPVLNETGDVTALIVTYDLGEIPTAAYQAKTAEIQGLDQWGCTAVSEMRINKGKDPRPQQVLTKPQPDTRDRTERRLEEIAAAALPDITSAAVTAREGDKPTAVRFEHKASFRALTNAAACETLERALVAALGWEPHTYRMTWDQQADVATLERWTDPLATVTPALPISPLTKVDLAAVPVGVREDGAPCTLNLTGGRHTLIVGATGAGKSSVVHSLFRGAAPAIHAGTLQLRGLCPKGGAELGSARDLFYDLAAGPVNSKGPARAFTCDDDDLLGLEHRRQLDLLTRAATDCLMRAYRLGAQGIRQHVPSVEEPAVWVVVDEIALVTAYLGEKKDRETAVMAIAALLTQGRAWNHHLVACLQDPRMRTLEIRNLFPVKVGLRLDSKAEVAMTLGDAAIAEGVRCDRISKSTPGVFYVIEDGGNPTRNRAAFVDDADVRDVCKRFPAPAWTPPPPMAALDLRKAVEAMVDPADLAHVEGALDELAEAVKVPPVKKAAPRKRTAKPKPTAPVPGFSGDEPVLADRVAVGDTLILTDEDGKRFHGTVAHAEDQGATVDLSGPGWERTVDVTTTMRRLLAD